MDKLVKGFLKFRGEVFGREKISSPGIRGICPDHLHTHPSVALPLRKAKVDLHGWLYSISTEDI
jgi:hypothetical protein